MFISACFRVSLPRSAPLADLNSIHISCTRERTRPSVALICHVALKVPCRITRFRPSGFGNQINQKSDAEYKRGLFLKPHISQSRASFFPLSWLSLSLPTPLSVWTYALPLSAYLCTIARSFSRSCDQLRLRIEPDPR